MRTTLRLDDDIFLAVKERARRERRTAGEVLSDLAREALRGTGPDEPADTAEEFGFRPLPHRGPPVTNELINRLREDGPE